VNGRRKKTAKEQERQATEERNHQQVEERRGEGKREAKRTRKEGLGARNEPSDADSRDFAGEGPRFERADGQFSAEEGREGQKSEEKRWESDKERESVCERRSEARGGVKREE
jgi:hypothetical protein